MKLILALAAVTLTNAISTNLKFPPNHSPELWRPAGPNDERAPCPMLNALANHGYLPHNGKAISEESTINALGNILNIEESLSKILFQGGLTTNSNENATTFSLADLSRHGILEHDASLSRQDFYFGDDHSFNQAIFDETRSYWQGPFIDVRSAARARQARVNTSNRTNPTFELDATASATSYGESASLILVFGNRTTGMAEKAWVEYLFENERLPYELGWTGVQAAISSSDLDSMAQRIAKATEDLLKDQ